MDKNSNGYLVLFAVAICVACSAALAVTFNGLKGAIDANEAYDKNRNVLKAVGYYDPSAGTPRAEVEAMFVERVERLVIRRETGEVVDDPEAADVVKQLKEDKRIHDFRQRQMLEMYRATHEGEIRYVLPLENYGLWSWLYGFLAVDQSGRQVIGITYYKDGETPGLGGEVNNAGWQEQWKGKKLYSDSGELVSVIVKKGKVDASSAIEAAHYVDGLSGATITCDGVTLWVKRNLEAFKPFFERISKQ